MPQSIRRPLLPRATPPAVPPPPDRYVKAIKVGELFRDYNVNINFNRSKNFLIGPNGSGKTTIVHILASCLRNDFTQLFTLPFSSAEITLERIGTASTTEITVRQKYVTETGRRSLEVSISGDNEHSEEIELRSAQMSPTLWEFGERRVASTTAGLAELIASLTNTTWLSIHRGEIGQSRIGSESLVDRHLANIGERLSQFNSQRNALIDDQNKEFQRRVFLSFLTPRLDLAALHRLGVLNIEELIDQLRDILRELGVRQTEAETNLTRYQEDLERAVAASDRRKRGRMGFNEEATLLSVNQANEAVASWSEYQRRVAAINQGVNELLDVLGEYFDRKRARLTNSGEMLFSVASPRRSSSGLRRPARQLRPNLLSSGEKQVYIFLMEALLQREVTSIFIADEPELSLHVTWQEQLVNSILRLAPNAQLIFATHSPDIVGSDQDAIIEMESVTKNA
jgi:predicted ATP-dependent endonuclease of OLD family